MTSRVLLCRHVLYGCSTTPALHNELRCMVLTKATFHDYDKMLERKEIEEKADDPVRLK